VKIHAGQKMELSAQGTEHAKSTDVSAILFFKAKPVTPASINTIMTPIVLPVIKGIPYFISAPHVQAEEIHLLPVKSALTDTSKILITIALYWGAPSANKIILDPHQIHLLVPITPFLNLVPFVPSALNKMTIQVMVTGNANTSY